GHSSPYYLTAVNGTLFFGADDGSSGRELWALAAGPEYTICLPLVVKNYVVAPELVVDSLIVQWQDQWGY
ncbi:MAG: hypothetical protein KAW49_03940, partial [Anaerolineae bacterium]|nr:hypothetical protein [Anaerolineae bacterium]